MYNRYISTDHGAYIPIPEEQTFQSRQDSSPPSGAAAESTESSTFKKARSLDHLKDLWSSLSGRLHLDSGDLLLLAMLYFLYREEADEELLIALGLLLFL